MSRNLFISHSWSYGDAYDRLVRMLDEASYFEYSNYSIPKDDPVHNAPNADALYQAIKNKVSYCNVVLIMAGKYASYSKWIQSEIRISKVEYSKPIVAICSWGAQQMSKVVQDSVDRIAKWNTLSIVDAIREVC